MTLNKAELEVMEKTLMGSGYNRYDGHYKTEDFGYWKSFEVTKDEYGDKVIGYQVAILFYDFSKYPSYTNERPIGVQFEFLLGPENTIGRVDLSISGDEMTPEKFEQLSAKFHKQFCLEFLPKKPI